MTETTPNPAFSGTSATAAKRRLCESGSLECSGLAPCPQCFVYIMVKVVPSAMRTANVVKTVEQGNTFFRSFVDFYRQTLTAKIEEYNSGAISPPVTTPTLLAYLEFREHFQKGYPSLLSWITSMSPVAAVNETAALAKETFTPAKETKPGNRSKKSSKKLQTGTKLYRGDVKRIAKKHAEQSLASSEVAGSPAVRRDLVNGSSPLGGIKEH